MSESTSASLSYTQNALEELKSFDWNDLGDVDSIGVWPKAVKILLGILLFCGCMGGGYWFHLKEMQAELTRVVAEEENLRGELETRAVLAANLEAYRQQMRDMEESFGELLRQLPGETEVPGLINDIYITSDGSGSVISSLDLADELEREFYIELPIDINMTGSFHDFGTFVSGVASLPRIVTLHDFSIAIGSNRSNLSMNINAKTYRYNGRDE